MGDGRWKKIVPLPMAHCPWPIAHGPSPIAHLLAQPAVLQYVDRFGHGLSVDRQRYEIGPRIHRLSEAATAAASAAKSLTATLALRRRGCEVPHHPIDARGLGAVERADGLARRVG